MQGEQDLLSNEVLIKINSLPRMLDSKMKKQNNFIYTN